jgi:uncharacterized protein YuzE
MSRHAWREAKRERIPVEMIQLTYDEPDSSEPSEDDELREIRTRWFSDRGSAVVVDHDDGRCHRPPKGIQAVMDLLLEYDASVDAAYLTVSDEEWDHQVRLDDLRGINYAADGSIIGVEILSPRRKGVKLDGLPFAEDIARVMEAVSFRVLESAR